MTIIILGLVCMFISAESVVPPGFSGHILSSGSIGQGEILLVEITQDLTFSITTARSSSNYVSFELNGGEGSDLLSFLPQGQTNRSRTIKAEEDVRLDTLLPVSIISVDENGIAEIFGERIMDADGGRQSISLAGSVQLSGITKGEILPVTNVLNARLSFTSIAAPAGQRLTGDDFPQVMEQEPLPDSGTPQIEGAVDAPSPAAGSETPDITQPAVPGEQGALQPEGILPASQYRLDEERRRELFILYMNEFMRLLFM